ncbi:hypothetical protein BH11BAC3_BH11BAC3_38250 [soil metagenome]
MSEKQFNHIENRIREAAENSVPDFDENAWLKMEARLDKEDKKRRFLFWWYLLPLLLIVGGVAYYFVNDQPTRELTAQKPIQTDTAKIQIITGKNADDNNKKPGVAIKDKSNNQPVDIVKSSIKSEVDFVNKKPNAYQTADANKNPTTDLLYPVYKKMQGLKEGSATSTITLGEGADLEMEHSDSTQQYTSTTSGEKENVNEIKNISGNNPEVKKDSLGNVKKDSLSNNIITNSSEKKPGKKVKNIQPSRFYLLASLGADAGSVKLLSFHDSKFTAKYGVGIGYQLNKKLSIQTGFYASRKKYIAGPGDYSPKAGSYWSMVRIVKVDAACLVYDIPVTLRYNFLQKGTNTYFATAGVSSYIMKKEDYQYYYTRNYTPYQSAWSYTGNKNYFSVFNFSAGIEKKLTSQFSILAEPSISIPISGVGDGRVKLYGAALQLSVKYQPSKKVSKK